MVGRVLFLDLEFQPSVKYKRSLKPYLVLVAFTVMVTELLSAPLLCYLKCWHKGSLS